MRRPATSTALALVLFGALACAWSWPSLRMGGPDLALLYNPAAAHHAPDRNPIIAIPGLLGSRLLHRPTDTVAWGAFRRGAARPDDPDGARLLALPIDDSSLLADLRDDVEAVDVLDRVRVQLGAVSLDIQAYAAILATLGAGGYRDESLGLAGEVDYGDDHFTCFQFPYDWRRDNVENARRLHAFILEKRAYVREEYRKRFGVENADVRFDIAAHSMGGLLTRYFLMYGSKDLPEDGSLPVPTWEGARLVERVILVGPPNGGSARALVELVEGRRLSRFLPSYPAALIGTFPAAYQLLPRSRHEPALWDGDPNRPVADLFDPGLWESMAWGLASPEQADTIEVLLPEVRDPDLRRRVALAFQARALRRARAFTAALDRPAAIPEGLEMFLVVGDGERTLRQVTVDSRDGSLEDHSWGAGDGTVLRSSALLDERPGGLWGPQLRSPLSFRSVLLLPDEHLDLTHSAIFRDNVLFWLLEAPRAGR